MSFRNTQQQTLDEVRAIRRLLEQQPGKVFYTRDLDWADFKEVKDYSYKKLFAPNPFFSWLAEKGVEKCLEDQLLEAHDEVELQKKDIQGLKDLLNKISQALGGNDYVDPLMLVKECVRVLDVTKARNRVLEGENTLLASKDEEISRLQKVVAGLRSSLVALRDRAQGTLNDPKSHY